MFAFSKVLGLPVGYARFGSKETNLVKSIMLSLPAVYLHNHYNFKMRKKGEQAYFRNRRMYFNPIRFTFFAAYDNEPVKVFETFFFVN